MSSIEIPLSRGKFAIIDIEDLEFVMRYGWVAHGSLKTPYAVTEGRNGMQMHRYIADCPDNMIVDHKNGNSLDNRKSNLRICTVAQNARNRVKGKGLTSKFKGVCKRSKNRWQADIVYNRKRYRLGRFLTEEEAAAAYNLKAIELHGEFANLKTIESLRRPVSLGLSWQ